MLGFHCQAAKQHLGIHKQRTRAERGEIRLTRGPSLFLIQTHEAVYEAPRVALVTRPFMSCLCDSALRLKPAFPRGGATHPRTPGGSRRAGSPSGSRSGTSPAGCGRSAPRHSGEHLSDTRPHLEGKRTAHSSFFIMT